MSPHSVQILCNVPRVQRCPRSQEHPANQVQHQHQLFCLPRSMPRSWVAAAGPRLLPLQLLLLQLQMQMRMQLLMQLLSAAAVGSGLRGGCGVSRSP